MINPRYGQLPSLPKSTVWAKLTRLDTSESYEFLVNPETIEYNYTSEWKELPVLNTSQPTGKYKYSKGSISIPQVRFLTPGSSKDLSKDLEAIRKMSQPTQATLEPPKVTFSWGELSLGNLRVTKFNYKVNRTGSGGKPTEATGSLELFEYVDPAKPSFEQLPLQSTDQAATNLKLSEREVADYTKKIADYFAKNKAAAEKFKVTPDDVFGVAEDGTVVAKGKDGKDRPLGKLTDILPPDQISAGVKLDPKATQKPPSM